MIYGIGVDVLKHERVERCYRRFGERFVTHLLLPAERAQFERTKRRERFLAMRFAAKEAVVKAMGTGFAHGMWIRDVGVVQDPRGKPEIVWSERGTRLRRCSPVWTHSLGRIGSASILRATWTPGERGTAWAPCT